MPTQARSCFALNRGQANAGPLSETPTPTRAPAWSDTTPFLRATRWTAPLLCHEGDDPLVDRRRQPYGDPRTSADALRRPARSKRRCSPPAGPRASSGRSPATTAADARTTSARFQRRLRRGYSRFHDGHPSPSQNREWMLYGSRGSPWISEIIHRQSSPRRAEGQRERRRPGRTRG